MPRHQRIDGPTSDTRVEQAPLVPARRLRRAALVVVPVGALAYALLFTAPGFDQSSAALRELRPLMVVAALVVESVQFLAVAQVYRSALASVGADLPYRPMLNASMAGYAVGQLLPGGGAVSGVVVAHRMIAHGAPRAAAAAAVVLMGTLSLLSLALLVSLGLLAGHAAGSLSAVGLATAVTASGVLALAVGIVLGVIRSPAFGNRLLDGIGWLVGRFGVDLDGWRVSLHDIAADPPSAGALARVVGWAALGWAADAGALWIVFAGLGDPLSLGQLLLGFGVENLAAMVPVSPGGLGLVEVGMAGTLTALGVASGTAVTGVVSYRVVSYWLPVVVCLPAYLRGPRPASADAS